MNVNKTIQGLRRELDRIEAAITAIEMLSPEYAVPKKSNRGRKSMDANERAVVSARMKRYWADRRERSA